MNYEEALEYIHSVNWLGSKPGLSRTRELLAALGNPQNGLKFVHIAGTNGKGSVSAMLDSVLRKCGYKTGLYTSPYIIRFNERIRVNGVDISDEDLAALVEEIKPFAEKMEDHPTEFEIITALGMLYFKRQNCDVVILETGLGGELDSTNIIDTPEVAVITAIGLDHTNVLGDGIENIARAKAGIIKENGDVVIYGGPQEADAVFENVCKENNAKLTKCDFSSIMPISADLKGRRFDYGKYKDIYIPLAGKYQMKNSALAINALEVLRKRGWGIADDAIYDGLAAVSWMGRFELLAEEPVFILDGSHNPHGAAALKESLAEFYGDKSIVFLTGAMADKDIDGIICEIGRFAKQFITVTPNNPRALNAVEYAESIRKFGYTAKAAESIDEGVKQAVNAAGKDGCVCAVGSLYMSADVRKSVETFCG